MAISLCPNIDDEHAPFPHRLVTIMDSTYVICTLCDHWIQRPKGTCECTYRCHPDWPPEEYPGGPVVKIRGKAGNTS